MTLEDNILDLLGEYGDMSSLSLRDCTQRPLPEVLNELFRLQREGKVAFVVLDNPNGTGKSGLYRRADGKANCEADRRERQDGGTDRKNHDHG